MMPVWSLKIPMRWKLLLLLLATALIPLMFVSALEFRNTLRLGTHLAGRTRDAQIRDVRLRLLQWIDDKAVSLQDRRHLLDWILRAQAREVERCLATAPVLPAPPIYFAENFDHGNPYPPGYKLSSKHPSTRPGQTEAVSMPVSYEEQAFHRITNLSLKPAMRDAARLASMTEVYRFLHSIDDDLIYWQFTALSNGLSCVYPGHGGNPDDYDPRLRAWYTRAETNGTLSTYGPYVDASTKELVLTLSMPVRGPNGQFAGVTALDVHVDDLARNLQLPPGWPSNAFAMLVGLEEEAGRWGLKVLSRPGYSAQGAAWDAEFKAHRLDAQRNEGLRKMIENMRKGISGMELISYEGKECLWGYGVVQENQTFLLAILPYQEIIADAVAAQQDALAHTRRQLQRAQVIFGVVIFLVFLIALLGSKAVTRPIHDLVEAARRVAQGQLETRVQIHTRDEIEELGDAFNQMVPQLRDRMRIKQSLELAREVQQQLLPAHPPRLNGFDIAGVSLYCDETGGDYYDYIEYSGQDPQLGIVIGDVTGHGIAAAMLMATARSLLRADAQEFPSLSHAMTQINRQLAADITGGRFMTLFYLSIHAVQREARWVSAGHDPAICYRISQDVFEDLQGDGPPLGIDPSQIYHEQGPSPLSPGDIVVLGTDGVWEARNPRGERFGKEALRDTIRRHASGSAQQVVQSITEAIAEFRQSRPQDDDITLVALKALRPA